MRLQTRFVLSISAGIVAILFVSELVRQSYERAHVADLEKSNPERMEAEMRASLVPIAKAVQYAMEDVMAEGNMDLLDKILARQQKVDGVLDVSVYNLSGKATHASKPDSIGQRMDAGVLDQVKESGKRLDRRTGSAFEIYEPFVATHACTQCHDHWKEGQVGGVLGLHMSNASFIRAQKSWLVSMGDLRQGTLLLGASVSGGLIVVLVLLVHALVRKQIIRPLATAQSFVEVISSGDLTKDVDPQHRKRQDEFGALSRAMQDMTVRLRTLLRNVLSSVHTIASTSQGLSALAEQTATGVERVSSKTETAAGAAAASSKHATTVAVAIEQATHSVSEVSDATHEMSGRISEVVQQSEQAQHTTEQAAARANSISASMLSLDEATRSIGQVTETITSISAQTNLLALNATIEAARAGALGKGFAVVAAEIKELAQQTARATQDVKDKIASVQASTANALSDLEGITAVIQEVGSTVAETASAMSKHAQTSERVVGDLGQVSLGVAEASRGVASSAEAARSIATDIADVNAAIGEIQRGGEQVQGNAKEMLSLAQNLSKLVEEFKLPAA
jgi:methyl-accepting chemotaxis protein